MWVWVRVCARAPTNVIVRKTSKQKNGREGVLEARAVRKTTRNRMCMATSGQREGELVGVIESALVLSPARLMIRQ